jgi:hypothetical protein
MKACGEVEVQDQPFQLRNEVFFFDARGDLLQCQSLTEIMNLKK